MVDKGIFWICLVTVLTVEVLASEETCSEVQQMFVVRQIGSADMVPETPVNGEELQICTASKTCCTQKMEDRYRDAVKKDFQGVLQATSSYLKNLISTNAARYQDQFIEMVRVSENNTNLLFADVYKNMAILAKVPIGKLYQDLVAYIQGREVEIEDSVSSFFDNLFPLVFHHTINPKLKDFSEEYKECLQEIQQEISPFGEIPRKMSLHLTKSFQAARSFLQALNLGMEVINTTDHIEMSMECTHALMKLTYCPHCQGMVNVKPCNGYCMNVVRGCLASVAEVDQPWNDYISALDRLAVGMKGVFNIEEVLSVLDGRISEAIMYAMEHGPQLSKKVKRACGHPKRATRETAQPPFLEPSARASAIPPPSTANLYLQIQSFMRNLVQSRGFYANLADTLCNDDNLAVRSETNCWNGNLVGEYTKTIAGIGVNAQKYNPEMKIQRQKDFTILKLNDKLRHIKQMLHGRITAVPESDSLRINRGSGSGHYTDDEDYGNWSGSGHEAQEETRQPISKVKKTGSGKNKPKSKDDPGDFEIDGRNPGSRNPSISIQRNAGSKPLHRLTSILLALTILMSLWAK